MLDFLLVLGQVPGTNVQITFNQILAAVCIAYLFYEYKTNEKQIRRWCKWAWHRLGVNYRRYKRITRTFVKTKRYRLAVFERRIIRNTKTYFRRKRRATILKVYRTRRLIRKSIRKAHLYAIDQTYGRYTRFVKATKRSIARRRRLIAQAIHRRKSAIKRVYYIKLVQIERVERNLYRSRTVQGFLRFKNFVSHTV
jgi:hypothetical protein